MAGIRQPDQANGLLASLSEPDFDVVAPHLERISVDWSFPLSRAGRPIEHVYFPESGVASVTIDCAPHKMEVGIIGREGFVGLAVALGGVSYPYDVFVQMPGTFFRAATADIQDAMCAAPALTAAMLKYVQSFLVQASTTAAANGSYSVEDRLARWLLMAHDRADGDEILLTHEFLSYMLGVRRPGVTVATHVLEGEGMIRARRGQITILDRTKLKGRARGSYGAAEAEYARLLGPFQA